MPLQHVFLERVVGREVEAAAEPPRRGLAVLDRDEVTHVRVRGRHVGIARVDHQRHAGRLEARAREFGPLRRRRRGQLAAHHVREVDAGLLEHRALAQHAALAAAAFGALPGIAAELRAAVGLLERARDRVVERAEVGDDCSRRGAGEFMVRLCRIRDRREDTVNFSANPAKSVRQPPRGRNIAGSSTRPCACRSANSVSLRYGPNSRSTPEAQRH